MSLELAILGFLSEKPATGYEIKTRCFEGPVGAFWTADQAQIYRTLERLKHAGLVSATRRKQASRPDRRVFDITRSGREEFASRLGQTTPLPPLRDPFLIQVYFSSDLDDDTLLSVLRGRRDAQQERLDELRSLSAGLAAAQHELNPRTAVMQQTALDGAMAQQRAVIDWLDECTEAVAAGALPGSERGTGQRHLFGT